MKIEDYPTNMLRLYRERSPLELIEHAKAFRKMPERDRAELLFYMLQHVNMALQQGNPTQAFEDVERQIKGGDA